MDRVEWFESLIANERHFQNYRDFEASLADWLRDLKSRPEMAGQYRDFATARPDELHRCRAGYLFDFARWVLGAEIPGLNPPESAGSIVGPLFWKNGTQSVPGDDLARRWKLGSGLDTARIWAVLAHP
jgi:hypothetical protein